MAFFENGHLFIHIQSPFVKPESPKEIVKRASKVKTTDFKNDQALPKFLDENSEKSELEGIWGTDDKNYYVGLVASYRKKGKYKEFL